MDSEALSRVLAGLDRLADELADVDRGKTREDWFLRAARSALPLLANNMREALEACPGCNGRGWNTNYETTPHNVTTTAYKVTCDICKGTGRTLAVES